MLHEDDVRKVLSQAAVQGRRIKGEDAEGPFHGDLIENADGTPMVQSHLTGEIRALDINSTTFISLNGSGERPRY